ncbi:MAG: hypothetical protein H0X40_02970 [Chthoniobacterales bacterium]|nr:hypothetical protein [Chthoniobacterales bacterium]
MIEFIDGGTIAGLQGIAAQLKNKRPLLVQVGLRGNTELRAWFRSRNSAPNKLGGRRANLWNTFASSVSSSVVDNSTARISVTDFRFNQKVYGGRITPKQKKSLTIPVAPESYGVSVFTFEHDTGIKLFLLRKKGGTLTNLLAGKLGDGQVKVFYVLSKGVNQDADPNALPPRAQFNAAILDEADATLRRDLNRA